MALFAHIPRWLRIIVYTQCALVIAIPFGGWLLQKQRGEADARQHPPDGRMVDVGGYRVHLYCEGKRGDGPVVVFNADSGDQGLIFRKIQGMLAGDMRTCAVDRGGFGWSDPGREDRSVPAAAREWHAALESAGEPGPFLLVGHGLGGVHALAFAGMFPEHTFGALLLDPIPPNCLQDRFDGIISQVEGPDQQAIRAKLDEVIAERGACPEGEGGTRLYSLLARMGMVRALAGRNFDPTAPTPELLATHRALKLRTAHADAVVQESATCYVRMSEAASALAAWKDKPFAVISRGRMGNFFEDQEFLSRRADRTTLAFETAQVAYLQQMHKEMQSRAGGMHRIAEDSAHYVQLGQPDLVAETIRAMIGSRQAAPDAEIGTQQRGTVTVATGASGQKAASGVECRFSPHFRGA
jgi:pimeloyl-ACP methyl ester carboxylesterase